MPVAHTLTNREQYSAAVVDSYTFTMPAGSAADTAPTGARNISGSQVSATFNAGDGEFFWNDNLQTQVSGVTLDLYSDRSALFVYRETKGWVTYRDDARTDDILIGLVPAGYGWGNQEAVVPFDIPGSPSFITLPFDTVGPTGLLAPRGCTFAPATETFSIDRHGIWRLDISFNIQGHNSVNFGRVFDVVIYDVTTASIAGQASVGLGRNQEDTFFSLSTMFQVVPSQVGDTFRVELGGGDAVTGGDLLFSNVALQFVSEFGSLIGS